MSMVNNQNGLDNVSHHARNTTEFQNLAYGHQTCFMIMGSLKVPNIQYGSKYFVIKIYIFEIYQQMITSRTSLFFKVFLGLIL